MVILDLTASEPDDFVCFIGCYPAHPQKERGATMIKFFIKMVLLAFVVYIWIWIIFTVMLPEF